MADPRDSRSVTHPFGGGPSRPSLPQLVIELKDLIVAYLKQETVVPIKQLGRYLAFGIAGSILMGVGVILMSLGLLRLLQTQTGDTFADDWSWVPYLIVFAALVIGAAIVWTLRKSYRVQKELRE